MTAITPGRTPGKKDFKRPTFALGKISLGSDQDDGSSSSSSSSGEEDNIPSSIASASRSESKWSDIRRAHTPLTPTRASITSSDGSPVRRRTFWRASSNVLADRSNFGGETSPGQQQQSPLDSTSPVTKFPGSSVISNISGWSSPAAESNGIGASSISLRDHEMQRDEEGWGSTVSCGSKDGGAESHTSWQAPRTGCLGVFSGRGFRGNEPDARQQQPSSTSHPSSATKFHGLSTSWSSAAAESDRTGGNKRDSSLSRDRQKQKRNEEGCNDPVFCEQRKTRPSANGASIVSYGRGRDKVASADSDEDCENNENATPSRTGLQPRGGFVGTASRDHAREKSRSSPTSLVDARGSPAGHEQSPMVNVDEKLFDDGVYVYSPSPLAKAGRPEVAQGSAGRSPGTLPSSKGKQVSSSKSFQGGFIFDISTPSPSPHALERLVPIGKRDSSVASSSGRLPKRNQSPQPEASTIDDDDDRFSDCQEFESEEARLSGGKPCYRSSYDDTSCDDDSSSRDDDTNSSDDEDGDFTMTSSTSNKRSGDRIDSKKTSSGEATNLTAPKTVARPGRFSCSDRRGAGDWEKKNDGMAWKIEADRAVVGSRESKITGGPRAFSVPRELFERMYPHQRKGVKWLWGLHQGDMGGILGDDMGLGKTFQVTSFIAGLFCTNQASCALVIAPKSVIRGWETELRRWLVKAACPRADVVVVASEMSAKARVRTLLDAIDGGPWGTGAVVVTTYGMVSANPHHFAPRGRNQKWDYVVLDEGHQIKNPSTKKCKAVHSLPARHRLLLTGTPVQNNLKELHTVVDWATFGLLLGPYVDFQNNFSGPIEDGQDKDVTENKVQRSRAKAAQLREILEPYLLQRTKSEIMDTGATTKTEMVVWVALSPKQREVYEAYLGGESVKGVLSGNVSSPLAAISHLKKVCLHPMVSTFPLDQPWLLDPNEPVRSLVRDSRKLSVMLKLVEDACNNGHRVLVFSRFTRMLDIIQRCIGAGKREGGAGLRLERIDGSRTDLERKHSIASFNENEDISVCLVSTGAGGTGITLTGADRVILFDPSWNPADDMQAVDRAYRIGQTRDVIVYRMIAAGTVEEKMYEKQVFKDGLRRTIMGGSGKRKKNVRYFSRSELKQLFTLFPAGECRVLRQLEEMHGLLAGRLEASSSLAQQRISLGAHLDFLCGLKGSYGASAHGEGLPKVMQHEEFELLEGEDINGGVVDSGGVWHHASATIIEESDESDAEFEYESDTDAAGSRKGPASPRRRARKGVSPPENFDPEEEEGLEINLCEHSGGEEEEDLGGRCGGRKLVGSGASGDNNKRGGGFSLFDEGSHERSEDGHQEKNDDSKGGDAPPTMKVNSDSDSEVEFEFNFSDHAGCGGGDGNSSAVSDVTERYQEKNDDLKGGDAPPAMKLGGDCDSEVEFEFDFRDHAGCGDGDRDSSAVSGVTDGFTSIDYTESNGAGASKEEDSPNLRKRSDGRKLDSEISSKGSGSDNDVSSPTPHQSFAEADSSNSTDSFGTPGSLPIISPAPPASCESSLAWPNDSVRSTSSMIICDNPVPSVGGSSDTPCSKSRSPVAREERVQSGSRDPLDCNSSASSPLGTCAYDGSDASTSEPRPIQASREPSRHWACDTLGLSPVASLSPRCLGSSCKDETGEGGEDVSRRLRMKADKVAASREKARIYAMEELGLEDAGRRRSSGGESEEYLGRGEEKKVLAEYNTPSSKVLVPERENGENGMERERLDRISLLGKSAGSLVDAVEEDRKEMESDGSIMTVDYPDSQGDCSPVALWESPAVSYISEADSKLQVNNLDTSDTYASEASPLLVTAQTPLRPCERVQAEGGLPQSRRETAQCPILDYSANVAHLPFSPTTPGKTKCVSPGVYLDDSVDSKNDRSGYSMARSGEEMVDTRCDQSEGGHVSSDGGDSRKYRKHHEGGEVGVRSTITEPRMDCKQPGRLENEDANAAIKTPMGEIKLIPPSAAASDSSNSCAAHRATAKHGGYKCFRCRCSAGVEKAEQAQLFLLRALEKETVGDLHGAMGMCLEAVSLCDENGELHMAIARIGWKMGCLR